MVLQPIQAWPEELPNKIHFTTFFCRDDVPVCSPVSISSLQCTEQIKSAFCQNCDKTLIASVFRFLQPRSDPPSPPAGQLLFVFQSSALKPNWIPFEVNLKVEPFLNAMRWDEVSELETGDDYGDEKRRDELNEMRRDEMMERRRRYDEMKWRWDEIDKIRVTQPPWHR